MKKPIKQAIKIIDLANEEEQREYIYRLWLVYVPYYTQDTRKTFNQFYDEARPQTIELDNRSKDEIMEELLNM